MNKFMITVAIIVAGLLSSCGHTPKPIYHFPNQQARVCFATCQSTEAMCRNQCSMMSSHNIFMAASCFADCAGNTNSCRETCQVTVSYSE